MALLTKIEMEINIRDGIDGDSTVLFNLYHLTENIVIGTYTAGFIFSNKRIELNLLNFEFDKDLINQTTFYMEIHAVGKDTFSGVMTLYFEYSDGTKNGFSYGDFEIGTYKKSHTTRKPITI